MKTVLAASLLPGSMAGRGIVLWLCVLGGLLICLSIVLVTIRHWYLHRGSGPAGRARGSLFAELAWVMIPVTMILALGGWIVAEQGHADPEHRSGGVARPAAPLARR